jgi:hypothetical protein
MPLTPTPLQLNWQAQEMGTPEIDERRGERID